MESQVKAWLFDILQAIIEIEGYFDGQTMKFESYQSDIRTKRAVERDLEIIGEAVNRITKRDPSVEIQNSRKIIATRNQIIHGYDAVSDEMIWSIVINHLPKLKSEVELLLKGQY